MPKGEMKTLEYNPGERPVESLPAEDGNYALTLLDKGKPGAKGWRKANPKKYPNRMLRFALHETEDEVTGKEKSLVEFVSLSPGFSLQKVMFMAYAAGYPKKLRLVQGPKGAPNDPSVMANMRAIDELLQWIEDNEKPLRAAVNTDTYNGRESNKVAKWLPPDTDTEPVAEESEETSDDEGEAAEESETEAEGEAEETTDDGDSEAEETTDSDEGEEAAEEDAEFEAIPPPRKKALPSKVKQGPAKKATVHPLKRHKK